MESHQDRPLGSANEPSAGRPQSPSFDSESALGSIVLVDDEETIRETVGFALRREGYQVVTLPDGATAWGSLQKSLPDLLILDILMPRMDGLDLCRRIRSKSQQIPILFLTSKDEEFDRVLGLELGADDYLCKPFSMRELLARVRVLFRRLALSTRANGSGAFDEAAESLLEIGDLVLDLNRYQARWKRRAVPLTVTEFRLLRALARHPGHVKTRAQLLDEGYPDDQYVAERTVDSHIKRLRRKFVDHDPQFAGIETVYGLGYRYRES